MSRECLAIIGLLLALNTLPEYSRTAGDFAVRDVNGSIVTPLDPGRHRPIVLVFITQDCPIANACAPEIERIYRTCAARRIGMYLVYVDPELTAHAARRHRSAYRYTCPALLDPRHRLARAGHVAVTPEAALFDSKGRLLYHGSIDDRVVALGQVRNAPSQRYLRDALDALTHGKPVSVAHRKAIGCSIADLGPNR